MLKYAAADRNKQPILKELLNYIKDGSFVLEIASGTGQHVVYFASNMPKVIFQPTECEENLLKSIKSYIEHNNLTNVQEPLFLDVVSDPRVWLEGKLKPNSVDYIINSNMFHIAPFQCTEGLFRGCETYLKKDGLLFTYGPYAYDGVISPQSNVNFNESLKRSNPLWGLRDVYRQLVPIASKHHLQLLTVHKLPANNDLIVWKKN
ncbi:hypothetical protein V9T40_009389 [Parthenolecanium corni]|uniref:Methyltransferase-like 26 n=1 Tax=Parthenolecanium corni TaxID=536013 RepID=A0AAN9TPX2_9HEMI